MRIDTATVLGLAAEGSTIEAAYDGPALRRLRAEHLGEMGRARETIWIDSAAFLVVRHDDRYDAPLSGKVIDSSSQRIDLTAPGTTPELRDSIRAVVATLFAALQRRD